MARPTLLVLGAIAVAHIAGLAIAKPLDEEACTALKAELAKLNELGVRTDMEKGADWAKANLTEERLARIARLIEVDEGISFRCPRPRPVAVAVPTTPSGAAEDGVAPAQAKGAMSKDKAKSKAASGDLGIDSGLVDLLNAPADVAKQPVPAKKKAAAKKPKPTQPDAATPAKAADAQKPEPAAKAVAPPAQK